MVSRTHGRCFELRKNGLRLDNKREIRVEDTQNTQMSWSQLFSTTKYHNNNVVAPMQFARHFTAFRVTHTLFLSQRTREPAGPVYQLFSAENSLQTALTPLIRAHKFIPLCAASVYAALLAPSSPQVTSVLALRHAKRILHEEHYCPRIGHNFKRGPGVWGSRSRLSFGWDMIEDMLA